MSKFRRETQPAPIRSYGEGADLHASRQPTQSVSETSGSDLPEYVASTTGYLQVNGSAANGASGIGPIPTTDIDWFKADFKVAGHTYRIEMWGKRTPPKMVAHSSMTQRFQSFLESPDDLTDLEIADQLNENRTCTIIDSVEYGDGFDLYGSGKNGTQ